MSQFDLQACDDRRYIQKLVAQVITEFAKLQSSVCTEASQRVTELLNTDRPVNVCALASPAVLTNIVQGRNTDALDIIFNSLGFPPYSAKVLISGYDDLTESEKKVLNSYLKTLAVREATAYAGDVLEEVIAKKVKCPTPARAAEIIRNVNRVKTGIIRVQKILEVLNKVLNITYSVIRAINAAIVAIRATSLTADSTLIAQAALPIGTSGLTARLIARLEKFSDRYQDELKELEKDVCDASKVVVYVATQLNLLTVFLQVVDALLQKCLGNAGEIETVQGLNLAAFGEIGGTLSFEYRGYTLEIRTDPNSPAIAPRRYAVALDPVGVVVLTGPASFSSSTEVLIEELKFRIDNQLG